ncbi:Metallo-dependent hydrolase [Daedaleopsis nitida]|nr:Metallo-dependent hydrolase [Daedaleopsis nitida]
MPHKVAGYAADALQSLTPAQIEFLQKLPKADLHAHLNGCIPFPVLQELANEYQTSATDGKPASSLPDAVLAGIEKLQNGIVLNEIDEFFNLFPAIYALTCNPTTLRRATRGVLEHFLSNADGYPQATYLELRTGPRETYAMSRMQYLEAVLDEVEHLDRRMNSRVASECIECAVSLRKAGRRVVGVDLCGDPKAGDMDAFEQHFRAAKEAGLGLTLHIAETRDNPAQETLKLLSFKPDRLGHATFLDDAAKKVVHTDEMCIEMCLSSNLLCKTVPTLDAHHIRYYIGHNHPIAICTDDILPFRNSLLGEYALLMAQPPLGLGLTEEEIQKIARMSMDCRFH